MTPDFYLACYLKCVEAVSSIQQVACQPHIMIMSSVTWIYLKRTYMLLSRAQCPSLESDIKLPFAVCANSASNQLVATLHFPLLTVSLRA